MNNINKANKGITLIALIITVIILLILAGTAISIAINGGDIFGKATDTREKWNKKVTEEESSITNTLSSAQEFLPEYFAPEGAVAYANETYYNSIYDAIEQIPSNIETTVLLLKDVSESVTIPASKIIKINLNRHTLQNDSEATVITVNGKLTLNNGTVIGTYTVEEKPTILVNENGEIYLSNTSVDRSSENSVQWETIELHGKISIDSGRVNSSNSNAICGYEANNIIIISGSAEIVGDPNKHMVVISSCGTFTMTGGNVSGKSGISNKGTFTMTGGNVSSETQPAISNGSGATAEITGGHIFSDSFSGISNFGTLNISGNPEISSTTGYGITNLSTLTISSGYIFSESNYGIFTQTGTAEITGTADIRVNGSESAVHCQGGTITLLGGSIRAGTGYALSTNGGTIYLSENCNVTGENDGTITPYTN